MRPLVLKENATTEQVAAALAQNTFLSPDERSWIAGAIDRWLQRQASNSAMITATVVRRVAEKVPHVEIGAAKLEFFSQDGMLGLRAKGS